MIEELTRHARISLALSQARHIGILTSAAVFARRLAIVILILSRPARSTVLVSGPLRTTIGDRAAADVARIARTSCAYISRGTVSKTVGAGSITVHSADH